MFVYNTALATFQPLASASVIFAAVQFCCIILNHFLNVGIVFGWPASYITSLMSNMPVGLSALVLGAATTSMLEQVEFDSRVNTILGYVEDELEEAKGGFWGSIAVMAVTGAFSFFALNFVNAKGPSDDDKKEL